MNGTLKQVLESYSRLLSERPGTVMAVAIVIAVVLAAGASKVQTVEQSQEDLLPDSIPSAEAFNTINEEFSGPSGTSYTLLVTAEPEYPGSNEVRDIRDPRALRFMESISNDFRSMEHVTSVSSPSDLFQDIPSSRRGVQQALDRLGRQRWSQYISEDYSAGLVQVTTTGLDAEEQMEMAKILRQAVRAHDKPAGLDVSYTGQPYISEAFQNQANQTMSITSGAALLGVMLFVILLFRSVFYGLTSLLTLVFGIAAGFGIFGWLGLNMTPSTSGAISMGIGIAIDFGIQPIARYIEEREALGIQEAIEETIEGVVTPMTVGLIAANIGFLTLNLGRVTFLSSLGTLLTLTTTLAYVSAFTVVPSAMILYDRYLTGDDAKGLKILRRDTTGEETG